MTVDLHKLLPTTPVSPARLQLYQPTRRPTFMTWTTETPWGDAKITGKIGQGHADLVEAMSKLSLDHRVSDTGQIQLLVDPYPVRKLLAGDGERYSYTTTWQMIEDLRLTSIDLRVRSIDERIMGGIIDLVRESPMTVAASRSGQQRHLWQVTFNAAYSALMGRDLPLYYDPAPIARIRSGVAQAIARHVLTHTQQPNGGWTLDGLIQAVGADGPYLRKRRSEIHNAAEQLLAVGIIVAGDRVFLAPRTP